MIRGVERLFVGGGSEEAHSSEPLKLDATISAPQVHASLTGTCTLTVGDSRPTADDKCK